MFELKFDAENRELALALGTALVSYGRHGKVETHIMESDNVVKLESAQGHTEAIDQSSVRSQDQSTAGLGAGGAQGATGAELDKNRVPFNPEFCAKAAKPFYASGAMVGQWKKGTKVSQEDYDVWYAEALANIEHERPVSNSDFDTSTAFSTTGGTDPGPSEPPLGIGAFIMWTSEMQTAKHLTQADITEAYKMLGLEQKDISPIEPNAQTNIISLHAVLSDKVLA